MKQRPNKSKAGRKPGKTQGQLNLSRGRRTETVCAPVSPAFADWALVSAAAVAPDFTVLLYAFHKATRCRKQNGMMTARQSRSQLAASMMRL
jgi:hypothetical protein